MTGTPVTPASVGTQVQAAGSANADGTAVSLLTNLSHDVEYLIIGVQGSAQTTVNTSGLLDILVDPAGGSSWAASALIDDLLAGEALPAAAAAPPAVWYHFPIWLKSGHSIGAQFRNAAASAVVRVVAIAYGGNSHPGSWWCGTTVTTLGSTAASSKGTDHTPGNTGAFSSWASLGSTLPAPAGALQFAAQGTNTDTTQNNATYHFEFGYSSTRIGPNLYKSTNTGEAGWSIPTGPIFCSVPSGTQMQVRGTCSATAEVIDVAAYAVH